MSQIDDLFPLATRPMGTTIIGQNGMGKTTLLLQLIRRDLENGIGCIVVDIMGDLSSELIAYASNIMPERTIVLQIIPETPLGLNLYQCPDYNSIVALDRTVDIVVQAFRRQWNEDKQFFPRIETVLKTTAKTILANREYTMCEIPLLFLDEQFRRKLVANVKNIEVLRFWSRYESLSPFQKNELTESSILRISQFLLSEYIYRVTASAKTTIPFTEVLSNPGRLLILRIPQGEIGVGEAEFIGTMFLSMLTNLIYEREKLPMDERIPISLFLDEYGQFASSSSSALLKRGRQYRLNTTVAFQVLSDLKDQENLSACLQTGTIVAFQTVPPDSEVIAPEFAEKPQEAWEQETRKEEFEQRIDMLEEEVEEDVEEIPLKPVEHLISSTRSHTNPEVRKAAITIITQLRNIARERQLHSNGKDAELLLNDLLVNVMEGQIQIKSVEFAEQAAELIIHGSQEIGWLERQEYLHWFMYAPWKIQLMIENFGSVLFAFLNGRITEEALRKHIHQEKTAFLLHFRKYLTAFGQYQKRSDMTEEEDLQQYKNYLKETAFPEIESFITFFRQLVILCEGLALDPIKVSTGKKRTVKRLRPHLSYLARPRLAIPHPQRTYADMVNEKAQELASLPRFTCMVQSIDAEGKTQKQTIRVDQPQKIEANLQGLDQIKQNSAQYYRKWEEVEQEIKKRQTISSQKPEGGEKEKNVPTDGENKKQISRKRTLQE